MTSTKRFTKRTMGLNAMVFVAKAINYTTDATIADFVANAPVGELGVFDANDALHNNAITSTESFYFAMRVTGGIKRTPLIKLTDLIPAAYKKAYVAPVKQTTNIGYTGSSGSLNVGTIVSGNIYALKIIETTEGFDPFPTWNFDYVTKVNDAEIDIAQGLAKQINDDNAPENQQNERLVTAKVKADATYSNYTMTGTSPTITFTEGSNVGVLGGTTPTIDIAAGDYISIDASNTPSDSVGDVYKVTAVSAGVSVTLNRVYTGTTIAMSQAQAQGTRLKKAATFVNVGIELTAVDNNTNFRIAMTEDLVDADLAYTTPMTYGNGTPEEVANWELEGQTYAGDTAKNVAFASKFGTQDTFTDTSETYTTYHFNYVKTIDGIAPYSRDSQRGYVVIAVALSAGDVDTNLDTLFGL